MSGIRAFREAFLSSDVQDSANFDDFDARRIRYQVYWAFYENTIYRDIHKFAKSYRAAFGLYKYIRNIYNPSYRLGEFWKAHLIGGALDPLAGDGKSVPSALPIQTENEPLRPALARVWEWSNWQTRKDILSLWGSVLGDAGIKIVDDVSRQKVYLQLVNPAIIKDVTLDNWGNVKAYTIEEERPDPRGSGTVLYQEVATRNGDQVVYQTLRNGQLYAWDGEIAQWSEPYGFIPLVMIQHNNVGLNWGWSEMHPDQSKFREADDLASKLSDQVRKMVDAPWLFSGVSKPTQTPKTTGSEPSASRPEPGREEIPAIYGPTGADAKPLVAPLDIGATREYIKSILEEIERDYPELSSGLYNVKGDISGRALRINQKPAEIKVQQRRPNYDNAIVRAQQMAISIGGFRGYDGFDGFSLESYAAGKLAHSIGNRPVFEKDPADDLDLEKSLWDVANAAKNAGIPLLVYLKRKGWTDGEIQEVTTSPEYQARMANLKMAATLGEQAQDDRNT